MTKHVNVDGDGFYAIQDGRGFASVYRKDIPGAGSRWFPTRDAAQAACDEWNEAHRPKCELCATKADLGGNAHNSDWVVVRDDHPMFSELVSMDRYRRQVRDIESPELYGDSDAYDFEGPC